MKKLIVLSAVAALATLVFATSASAQIARPKTMIAGVACHASTAVCVKLDLYQKIAATGEGGSASASGGQSRGQSVAPTSAANPVTARRTRASGGVENNPVDDGGGAARLALARNADRQAKLLAQNAARQGGNQLRANRSARPGQDERMRSRLVRRGDDPTINNPDATGGTARPQAQAVERAQTRVQRTPAEHRMPAGLRLRETSRIRPSEL
jgi:hypothetical protein